MGEPTFFTSLLNKTKKFCKAHKTTIVTSAACLCVGITVAQAISDTLDLSVDHIIECDTKKEKVIYVGKTYWKTIVLFVISLGVIIAGVHSSSVVALTAINAYNKLAHQHDNIITSIGELSSKKKEEIEKKIVEKSVKESKNEIIETGHGKTLFLDKWTGRKFRSDVGYVDRCWNEVVGMYQKDDHVALSEFYWLLGLEDSECSDLLGWNTGIHGRVIHMHHSKWIETENGEPMSIIEFGETPCFNFD